MRDWYKFWPCAFYLLGAVLYDLIWKGTSLLPPALSLSDFAAPVCLCVMLFSAKPKCWQVQSFFIVCIVLNLLFFLKVLLALDSSYYVLRELQFVTRFQAYMLLPIILLALPSRARLIELCIFIIFIIVAFSALIDLILALAGLDFLAYSRSRQGRFIKQVTGFFYEPAALSQFVLFVLFVSTFWYKGWMKRTVLILSPILIILTQSLGGFFGLFAYGGFIVLRSRGIGRKVIAVFVTGLLTLIVGLVLVSIFPDSRVGMFFYDFGHAIDTSAQRRTTIEYQIGEDFFLTSGPVDVSIGLKPSDADQFRIASGLIEFDDNVAGNGIVEFLLRYGVIGTALLLLSVFLLGWNLVGSCLGVGFFMLLCQIDGAIAKPWIFAYMGFYAYFSFREGLMSANLYALRRSSRI